MSAWLVPLAPFMLGLICALSVVGAARAEVEATTDDGRRVLLNDDHTWTFVDGSETESRAGLPMESGAESDDHVVLEVVDFEDVGYGCLVRLKVTNNQGHMIKSLVPQFHALIDGDILYEKLFMAFSWVKPTRDQSKAITYAGLACADIARIQVVGADRCEMGTLSKHSVEKGECLKRIRVQPSPLVTIGK